MGLRSTTQQLPPLELRASVMPKSLDPEKRTVQVTWTTGKRVLRGYFEQYYEELSLDPKHVRMKRLQGAPLLDTHSRYSVRDILGVVEDAKLEAKRGTATIRFDTGPEGEDAFRKISSGMLRDISVGYRIHKMEKVEDGAGKIPVYRAVDWEPFELSPCPIGADDGAGFRSDDTATNPCEFEERTMDPDETPNAGAAGTPSVPPKPAPAAPSEATIRAAEQARVVGIQRVGRALKRSDDEVTAAIVAGTSLADYRAQAQDAFAAAETIVVDKRDPRVDAGDDRRDRFARGVTAWILQRAGVTGLMPGYTKLTGKTVETDPGEFRGLRLIDIARQSLELAGVRTAGLLPMEFIGQALTMRSTGGLASTSDFPMILENALYKVLLGQYATTPDTWSRFCKRGSVSDFRASKRYRLGSLSVLSALGEGGEFVSKSIPDAARESLTAATKGNIIGITRQSIINDDMSAFATLATMLGRAAKLTIEVDVYALLALNAGLGPTMGDGQTMFHATHGNITTGAALSAAALDLDRVAMKIQRDPSLNELLDLTPAILLVPASLGGQARVINDSAFDPDTLANKAQMKANIAGKMFNDIIDTGRMTGTRRYLFADVGLAPCIEVAFLDGQEQPFMDVQNGWRVDGVEWKVRLDFGVAGIDYRGAVTNAGA